MSLNLEVIQEMWEKDAKIDRDNLHEESLNIPSLHAKYFELYNTISVSYTHLTLPTILLV